MNSQDVIAILQQNGEAARAGYPPRRAVRLARGEARPDSDIDIMIELDPRAEIDIFTYAGQRRSIDELFDRPVDVVNKDALKPSLREPVAADAVYAF